MNTNRKTVHVVPEGTRIVVNHLHQGNSSRNARHGKDYMTIARLMDGDDDVLSIGYASCSRQDTPSRAVGREIAVGRCIVSYNQAASEGEFYAED